MCSMMALATVDASLFRIGTAIAYLVNAQVAVKIYLYWSELVGCGPVNTFMFLKRKHRKEALEPHICENVIDFRLTHLKVADDGLQ